MMNHFEEFDIIPVKDEYEEEYKKTKNIQSSNVTLFDWLNSINFNKTYLWNKENDKKYPQYMINWVLSKSRELIFYIDALNNMDISNKMHYDFLMNAIPSKKRYIPFGKKNQKNEDIELVKKFYNISYSRASKYYSLLNEDDISEIRKKFDSGGLKK